MTHDKKDIGESLVEVVLTIVIVGLTITALISSLATVANAGTAQRNSVVADVVLRNYAEATKTAAQSCVANVPYTVTYPPPLPAGFAVVGANGVCPTAGATKDLTLAVSGPLGAHATMHVEIRTP
jgi:type II secretory pathway pseudopilin PulG